VTRETLRPLVHAGALAFVCFVPVLGRWGTVGLAGAAFLANLLVLPRTPLGRGLAREGERRWNGTVSYPLAVAIGFALFPGWIAAAAWGVMALGDAAASLVGGTRAGALRLPWHGKKSFAGTAAFLVAGAAGALGVLVVVFPGESGYALEHMPDHLFTAIVMGTVAAAAVESIPLPVDDNLPILLAAGGGMALAGMPL